jgi:hypothetical protein
MANKKEITDYLDNFSRINPNIVVTRLFRGSKLMKNLNQRYEIDNVNLDEELGNFPVGAIPYGPVYKALKSDGSKLREVMGDCSCIPFSKVFRAGVGQCLEKAILLQLATQRNGGSYLVSGALELDEEAGAEFPAFNLVSRGESVYLVDAENPYNLDKEGNVARPYVVPVISIAQNGTIIVPEEYRAGRTYCLG